MGASGRKHGEVEYDIQILRALAAILVLVDHSGLMLFSDHRQSIYAKIFGDFGTIGVSIFFTISGYIMVHTKFDDFGVKTASLNFFIRRILRIAPLYYFATICAYLILSVLLGMQIEFNDLIRSILFIPFYSDIENKGFYPVLGVGWTLNMEMFFYAIFAMALLLKREAGIFLVLAAISILVTYGYAVNPGKNVYIQFSPIAFYTNNIMGLFAAGVLIRWLEGRISSALKKANIRGPREIVSMAAVLIPIATAVVFEMANVKSGTSKTIQWLSILPLIATIGFGIGFGQPWRKAMVFIGDASYSIYIFHSLFLLCLALLWKRLAIENDPVLVIANIVIALAGSIFCYFLVERKFRKWIERPGQNWLSRHIETPKSIV